MTKPLWQVMLLVEIRYQAMEQNSLNSFLACCRRHLIAVAFTNGHCMHDANTRQLHFFTPAPAP